MKKEKKKNKKKVGGGARSSIPLLDVPSGISLATQQTTTTT
jgi:hypothetical protein